MNRPHVPAARMSAMAKCALVLALLAGAAAAPGAQSAPVDHRDITFIMPWFFGGAAERATEIMELRTRLGETADSKYVRVGFTDVVVISMNDWNVNINDPAAIRAALSPTFAQIDANVAAARVGGYPIVLSIWTALRSSSDPVQTASEAEDIRSMQWYADNVAARGWWTHSRYARKARAVQEAYVREVGRKIAEVMALYPDTVVAAAGDGEVELAGDRWLARITTQPGQSTTPRSSELADFSPFAIAEFRDWLRCDGLYGTGQPYAGQCYEFSSRYAGDATPADPGVDGRSFNADFGMSFATWDLLHFNWTLTDAVNADPNALPARQYDSLGNLLPGTVPNGFDAPRTRVVGNAYWEVWSLFRQTMIHHHNRDFAKWMTTTTTPDNKRIPADRWFSYQIPSDYLFGATPGAPNDRFITSASPWWSADISPYGGLGITGFATNLRQNKDANNQPIDGPWARTLPGVAPLIAARNRRWGIIEWNPSVPTSLDPSIYQSEMALLERYRPSLLAPWAWTGDNVDDNIVKGSAFETALKGFVGRLGSVPATCAFSLPSTASLISADATYSVDVTAASTTGAPCPWTPVSNAPWITIATATSNSESSSASSLTPPAGVGNGTLSYSVAQNNGGARTGTITVGGHVLTVTQAEAPCAYTVTPTSASFHAAGGTRMVSVTTNRASCTWAAAANASFLSITAGTNGTGTGTVTYTVAANTAATPRSGAMLIAGTTVTISQARVLVPNPIMSIDSPGTGATLRQPFLLAGWAIDRGSEADTGVSQLHVWAHPAAGAPKFVGLASYGAERGDVGGIFGSQFTQSGFNVLVNGLAPGAYTIVAYAYSTVSNSFNQARAVAITIPEPQSIPVVNIDMPGDGSTVSATFTVAGWAIDLGSDADTGVSDVHVYAWPDPGSGKPPTGQVASYGGARGDVGGVFGSRFTNSAFATTFDNMAPGAYQISIFALSRVTGKWAEKKVNITVQASASLPTMSIDLPRPNTTPSQPFRIAGWAIDRGATTDAGISNVHIYALGGGQTYFLGEATYNLSRPDVGAAFGDNFTNSGFNMLSNARGIVLPPGEYDLRVYVKSTVEPDPSRRWNFLTAHISVQ